LPRSKSSVTNRARHKRVLESANGQWGARHTSFKAAHIGMMKSLAYSFADRKARSGDMRKLWIVRINAASRLNGLTYGRLINGLNKAGVAVNRKMLSEMAIHEPSAFAQLANVAKGAVATAK
jgi:large subunit ribosomal protein L20